MSEAQWSYITGAESQNPVPLKTWAFVFQAHMVSISVLVSGFSNKPKFIDIDVQFLLQVIPNLPFCRIHKSIGILECAYNLDITTPGEREREIFSFDNGQVAR